MLEKVKAALRLTTDIYDAELMQMIHAALADLAVSDIDRAQLICTTPDPLITMAVITYCRIHFGSPEDYERLQRSYDLQKAQLNTATGYGFPRPEVDPW